MVAKARSGKLRPEPSTGALSKQVSWATLTEEEHEAQADQPTYAAAARNPKPRPWAKSADSKAGSAPMTRN
eukprot:12877683-Alexandrium_andersonii.AAC.1